MSQKLEGEETLEIRTSKDNYPIKELRLAKDRVSVFDMKRRLDDPKRWRINLQPDFQRNPRVWKTKQRSELIESILIGIPLPVIYMIESEKLGSQEPTRQVIDGLQRLTCIQDFLNEKFALRSLKILPNINEKKFLALEPFMQNRIEDYQLEVYTILPPVPDRVKFDVFDRLNRGGTQLNNQEMRNAIYCGRSTTFINSMCQLESFKQLMGEKLSSRMKDRYLVLRFVAFYLLRTERLGDLKYTNMDDFLAEVMKWINQSKEETYEDVLGDFDQAMKDILVQSDDSIFRFKSKERKSQKRPINIALFECFVYLFVRAHQERKKIAIEALEQLKDEFEDSGTFASGVESPSNIEFRFAQVEEMLRRASHD
ncbi:DUF262 domain-containing protein [Helicobacter ailurogastricus]|uniref:DUF262 domain-containing protein n=1 Tax=Helicobacter ailurogastricus TaxID=1578720 RepID=UPI000CF029DE|nr:DUF262 domain-containing protein [Helicobacter ailurogastricus]GMB91580.1 hypothetical protein NHP190009_07490 [Helicobacter ailurogastricus]